MQRMRKPAKVLLLLLGRAMAGIIVRRDLIACQNEPRVVRAGSPSTRATNSSSARRRKAGVARRVQTGRNPGAREAAQARDPLRRPGRRARRLEPVRRAHRRGLEPHRRHRHPAMDEIPGVEFVQGDFREDSVVEQVWPRWAPKRSILYCPTWPPIWLESMRWISPDRCTSRRLALEFADRVLAPGGDAFIKLFQGAGFDEIVREARRRYGRVVTKKPKASRTRSPEIYLLARQFGMV